MQKMVLSLSVMLILVMSLPVLAQDDDERDTCDRLPPENLAAAATECAELEAGEICYGFDPIELVITCEDAPPFETVGQRLPLEATCAVTTRDSGIALLRLQPEVGGTFIALFGESSIQSVASGQVGVETQVASDADVYSGPGSNYEVIGTVSAGETITVNACNCTHNWVRIMREDQAVGWVPARRIGLEPTNLEEVTVDTPVFTGLQAFTFSGGDTPDCDDTHSGILVQADDDPALLQVNQVILELTATAFIRVSPDAIMQIDVLDGTGRVQVDGQMYVAPSGSRVNVTLDADGRPTGEVTVRVYDPAGVAQLPLELLPVPLESQAPPALQAPTIVSVAECAVVSDTGVMACPLQFVNPDGDDIVQMNVEFVYAALGEWQGGQHTDLTMLAGDMQAGTLGWSVECSQSRRGKLHRPGAVVNYPARRGR
jgi:hypothetical protein